MRPRPSSDPLPMRPAGAAGRLFVAAMEWINAPAYRLALDALAPLPDDRVLEIAFGTGRLIEMIVARATRGLVAGVDPTATMLEVALARRGLRQASARVDLRLGDAESLPWPAASFDRAVAVHSFQFWSDPHRSLREVARVLRSGGRMVLVLRLHERSAPAWLPNAISRGEDEIGGTCHCLAETGFEVEPETSRPRHVIVAHRR